MCNFLFAVLVVGAIEATPGYMEIDYVFRPATEGDQIETMMMPTEDYLACYEGFEKPENVE